MNNGVPYLAFSPRGSGIDFYSDNLVTSEKQIKTHPQRVADFRAASLRGWQYALSHKEEIVDLILRRYSQAKIVRPFSSKQTRRKCLSNRA